MHPLQSESLAATDKTSLLSRLHIDRDDDEDTNDAETPPARRLPWKGLAGVALAALAGAGGWSMLGRTDRKSVV